MAKKKLLIFVLTLLSIIPSIHSQENTEFKPSGNIIARGFVDFSTGFGNKDEETGFDITRALLGYNYKFTKSLQAQVVIDGASGTNEKGNLEPYLRNAFLTWEDNNLSISTGLIGLLQFSLQEKYWAHRYVLKSFQDLNKMGASVDAGATAEYKLSPLISFDATIVNGEGYKKIQKDNSTRYGLGISVSPVKNLIFRVYGDVYNENEKRRDALPDGVTDISYKNQYILSLFTGYKNDLLSAGLEYNHQRNKGFIENKNSNGYSAYLTTKVAQKWNIYGRYDLLKSESPDKFTSPWNDLDGQLFIIGAEFCATKQLKISPNFRNLNSDNKKSEQYLFVNLEFNL